MELLILHRLTEGCSYQAISEEVFLSVDTVKYHIRKVYRRLGIHRQQKLVRLLHKYGIRLL